MKKLRQIEEVENVFKVSKETLALPSAMQETMPYFTATLNGVEGGEGEKEGEKEGEGLNLREREVEVGRIERERESE